MKFIFLITLALAIGALAGKKPGKPNLKPKGCEIQLDWGFGWCEKNPFNYRCNDKGRFEWDKYYAECNKNARCRCEEKK